MEWARVVELSAAYYFDQRQFAIFSCRRRLSSLASLTQACAAISQWAVFCVPGWKGIGISFLAGGTSLTLDARFPFVMAVPVYYVFVALARPLCWFLRLGLPQVGFPSSLGFLRAAALQPARCALSLCEAFVVSIYGCEAGSLPSSRVSASSCRRCGVL